MSGVAGQVATEQIVYPDHTPAAAAGMSMAELADELARMLVAYVSPPH